jgi:hypothetical protein
VYPAARAAARPRQWRPLSGQLGASAISAIERGVLHHPLHELVDVVPANAASSGTGDVSVMPGWGLTSRLKRPCSLDAVVEAEIRNSSRPGSQAPHAPPALTFGLPGKQRVKSVQAGCVLIRLVSTLPRNRKVLPMNEPDHSAGRLLGSRRRQWGLYYFCARLAASAIWSCRKSANSMP